MPIHKERDRWVFKFNRVIDGRRFRSTHRLPKGWSRSDADKYDQNEVAKLYAAASGTRRERALIEQAVILYLGDKAEGKTIKNTGAELYRISDFYTGKHLEELPEIAREITKHGIAEGWTPATIRNRIAYLRAACRWGWKQHKLCDSDPGGRIQMPTVRNERANYLARSEAIQAARRIKNLDARAALLIGFYSGMRVGEVIRARPEGGVWTVTNTKNGDDAYVPIMPKVAVYARRWPRQIARITVQSHARKAFDAIGRPDASFHTLRHSTATAILAAGETLDMVGDILRHKDKRSTQRYAHRQRSDMAAAMMKLQGSGGK